MVLELERYRNHIKTYAKILNKASEVSYAPFHRYTNLLEANNSAYRHLPFFHCYVHLHILRNTKMSLPIVALYQSLFFQAPRILDTLYLPILLYLLEVIHHFLLVHSFLLQVKAVAIHFLEVEPNRSAHSKQVELALPSNVVSKKPNLLV